MNAVRVKLNLLEPVLVSDSSGDPNTNAGLPYIPGGSLRGAFIQAYRQKFPAKANPDDSEFRHLFLDGTVRYLNAYPVSSKGRRCLPFPQSWFSPKGKIPIEILDFALDDSPDKTQTWKAASDPEIFIDPDQPEKLDQDESHLLQRKTSMQATIHNQRAIHPGVDDDQAVFRYLAIAPDQEFEAVILVEDSELQKILMNLPGAEIMIGRSHKANYGRVSIQMEAQSDWQEAPREEIFDRVVVTLLSDAILRDPQTGSICLDPGAWFAAPPFSARLIRTFTHPRVISGFNRTWGLPAPQTLALSAGSVLVFEKKDDVLDSLISHQADGIGERRAEGFGRYAINLTPYETIVFNKDKEPTKPDEVLLTGSSAEIAAQISESILRQELEPYLHNAIHRIDIHNPPSNSQLSRLGEALKRAQRSANPQVVLNAHFKDLRPLGRNQFQNARIENTALDDWLLKMFADPKEIWEVLGANNDIKPKAVGKQAAKMDDLALEYIIRFVDGLIHKTRKAG